MPWGIDAVSDELHMLSALQVSAQVLTLAAGGIPTSASPSALTKLVSALSKEKLSLPNDVRMLRTMSLELGALKKKNPVEKALAINAW